MSEVSVSEKIVPSLTGIVEHRTFKGAVLTLIVLNAVLLGFETSRSLPDGIYESIVFVNHLILGLFVIELILRITAYRLSFFSQAWNVFDFVIIVAALAAPTGPFQVVRSLRILRAVRLVSSVPSLRRVVEGMLGALPGIGSVLFLLILVLYVAGVMATVMFRDVAPEEFGHLGLSLYSLFQVMTLEGWADIAQRVMDQYTWAWMFFVGFILIATFLVLNLVIGVVVGSIQSRIETEIAEENLGDEALREELSALRQEIFALRESLESRD
jgi:voltage-gated sodium channel